MKSFTILSFISLASLVALTGCAPTDNLVGTTTTSAGGTTANGTTANGGSSSTDTPVVAGAAQGGSVVTTTGSGGSGNAGTVTTNVPEVGGTGGTSVVVVGGAGGITNTSVGGTSTVAGAAGQGGVVMPTDHEVCVQATVNIHNGITTVSYERGTFDSATLVAEWVGTAAPEFTSVSSRRYARYDQQGRELMHGDANTGHDVFRWDYSYNEHGDQIEAALSYPAALNVLEPPSEPYHMREQYSHEYDASGRLVSTTCTALNNGWSRFVRQTYVTDALGNCSELRVDAVGDGTVSAIERRGYDSLHRLIRTEVVPSDGVTWPPHSVTTYSYDEQGRMLTRQRDGTSNWGITADGVVDLIGSWTYAADGTTTFDSWEFTSDTPNEIIERNGTLVGAYHYRTIRSPGCAKLDAQIGAPPVTGACHF